MADAPEKTDDQKRQALAKIVADCRTALFVTQEGSDLFGRPMANAKVEEQFGAIWFATKRDSGKIANISRDQHVLLGYTNASGSEWASVSGKASLVDDRAKIKELWSPMWKNWFEGPDDPNILLIRVEPTGAEYWDSGSQLVTMVKLALAAATGKHFNEGEHARLSL